MITKGKKTTGRQRLLATTLLAGVAAVATPAAVAVVGSAFLTSAAVAQDFTTSTLEGTVLGTDGAPVAGATVVVQSNDRGLSRTLTTDASGGFRAPQIPVGSYSVSISKEGYDAFKDEHVSVALGSKGAYEFVIDNLGSVEEVVVVGTRSAGIDFDRVTGGITVDVQETFDRVPTARSLAAVQMLAPQTTQGDSAFGDNISISGSSVAENVYYINGFNITNFRNFLGGNTVPFEFYEQIDIKTGAYPAEFGRSTGGAVVAVTRSGSNEFHGGANAYFEPQGLREVSPNTVFQDNEQDERTRSEQNVWLSGPIMKDHIYFFGFYNWRDIENSDTDSSGVRDVVSQSDPFFGGKLDFYLNDDHRLELTYFSDDQSSVTKTFAGSGEPGTTNTFLGGETKIAKYTGNFTDWFTLSALYGEGTFNQTVSGTEDAEVAIVDTHGSQVRGNPALLIEEGADARKLYRVDADIYADFFGSHHFRLGFDREDLTSEQTSMYSGGHYVRYYQPAGGAFSGLIAPGEMYIRDRLLTSGGTYKTEQSAFYVQDAWDVTDRLSLNVGLRFEKFSNMNAEGETFVETDYDISPRLGATYDLFGDQKTKLTAFFGRYYIPIAANTNIRMAGNELFTENYYRVSGIEGGYAATAAGLDACAASSGTCLPIVNGPAFLTNILSPGGVPESTSLVSQNLEAQYQDEWILGVEHEFDNGWTIGARVINRDLKSVMEDFDTGYIIDAYCAAEGIAPANCGSINGAGYVLLNPGKDLVITPDSSTFPFLAGQTITIDSDILDLPQARRTYKALELTFARPWDGKWSLQGSWVMAESKGNVEGGVKSENGQDDTGLTQDFDEPGWTDGAYGFLPNHRAHTVKLFGSLALTDDITMGANLFAQSPRKYGCIGSYPLGDGRGSPTTMTAWYCGGELTPRGSQFEGEWQTRLDLSAAWNVPLTMVPGKIQLRADVFNVFNGQSVTDYWEFGDEAPGSADMNYREPTGYQTPRYVRLGASYQF